MIIKLKTINLRNGCTSITLHKLFWKYLLLCNAFSEGVRPCTWAKPGRFGNFFVLCFLALGGHCLQMFCLPGFGTQATPRICHIFVLSLLLSGSTLPRNAYFSRQTLNCQIVPVLPSYLYIPFWGPRLHYTK